MIGDRTTKICTKPSKASEMLGLNCIFMRRRIDFVSFDGGASLRLTAAGSFLEQVHGKRDDQDDYLVVNANHNVLATEEGYHCSPFCGVNLHITRRSIRRRCSAVKQCNFTIAMLI